MNKKQFRSSIVLAAAMCLLALLFASAATYAWFSNNAQSETSGVTGRTSVQEVKLELSTSGGDAFDGSEECVLTQVNSADCEYLQPVSTVDLSQFVYCPNTVESMAVAFSEVEDEKYYYHGRIYIRATTTGGYEDAKVAIYFDERSDSGGLIVNAADGESMVLCAARLGLMLDEDPESTVILQLTEQTLSEDERAYNTKIGDTVQSGDIVLKWTGSDVSAVTDPSKQYTEYVLSEDGSNVPEEPLFELETNRIYALDVYFYLEGCDPDCTEYISYQAGDLHLAFYGLIS